VFEGSLAVTATEVLKSRTESICQSLPGTATIRLKQTIVHPYTLIPIDVNVSRRKLHIEHICILVQPNVILLHDSG
jgi:hypothetical protein